MKDFKIELQKLAQIKKYYRLEAHPLKDKNKTALIGIIKGKAVSISVDYVAKTISYKSIGHSEITHYCR